MELVKYRKVAASETVSTGPQVKAQARIRQVLSSNLGRNTMPGQYLAHEKAAPNNIVHLPIIDRRQFSILNYRVLPEKPLPVAHLLGTARVAK
jgi:hypothetical protein